VEALEGRLLPTAYVVTTAKDVLGDTAPGELTLRDALTALDGTPSGNATAAGTATNSITFAIPGAGPQEIDVGGDASTVNQALPAITGQVFLDGWSQGGPGYQGPPLIVLNGASAGFLAIGLTLQAGSDGSTVRGLVVQQFDQGGIAVIGTGGNLIAGNYVGTDASGTVAVDNRGAGILLAGGATANTVGGTAAADANVISGNEFANGLAIDDGTTSGNLVIGNLIGTGVSGAQALGNNIGVDIFGATDNTIGGTAPGSANVISGNAAVGVVCDSGASGNVVIGNRIGTDASGTAAVGNSGGVFLGGGATANTIGGTAAGTGNLISGNGGGVGFGGATGNVVLGNLIGTDVSGTAALGNQGDGVYSFSDSSPNTIGGTAPGAGNVISGNGDNGLMLTGGDSGFVVLGNRIGTDVTGTRALGNAHHGIIIDGPGNVIGGTAPGAGNVISANGQSGVTLSAVTASGNVVLGNLIGTDITGTVALGNADDGVLVNNSAHDNTIGGTAAGEGNLISGNGKAGVRIGDDEITVFGIPTAANVVQGNRVGTDVTGTAPLGNGQAGVRFDTGAARNTVGGTAPGSGNVIAFNGKGVVVADNITTGASVLGNSIYGNAGVGIDLGDDGATLNGVNPRDLPNHGQNAPALAEPTFGRISGTLSSTPRTEFRVELFAGPPAAGLFQGQTFLVALDVATDAAGAAAFAAPFLAVPAGSEVTATATNLATGDTSEFSPAVQYLPTVYVVTTDKDILGDTTPGEVTLRDALTAVNGTPSGNATAAGTAENLIAFAIPGPGPHTIRVGGDPSALNQPLPAITNSVFIDGWLQAGVGYSGPPLIVLDGADAGAGADGLELDAGSTGSLVRGLAVQRFGGNGIELRGASGSSIVDNFIGTDGGGVPGLGNGGDGVRIDGGARANTVGGSAAGSGNVIAFNAEGVVVADSASTGDSVLGNSVYGNAGVGIDLGDDGATPNGANPRDFPNHGQNAPALVALSYVRISGTLTSVPNSDFRLEFFASPPAAGVPEGRAFLGSFDVPTDATGGATFAAPVTAIPPGWEVTATSTNLATGDTSEFSAGLPFLPNVYVVTTDKDVLGDTTPGELTLRDALTALDGTPSGNATAAGTDGSVIVFAIPGPGPHTIRVGSDLSALNQPLPAVSRAVFLDGWSQGGLGYSGPPLVVLNGAGAGPGAAGLVLSAGSDGSLVRGLVIQQFAADGLDVNGTGGNLIAGNYVGTDATGGAPLGNGRDGISLAGGASNNTVGGTGVGAAANVLSGNGWWGLNLGGAGTSGNVIAGNEIGTDASGTAGLGNGFDGLRVSGAAGNTISGNVISANAISGVFIIGGDASGNLVTGNLIGTDRTGTASLNNAVDGVYIGLAPANTIGGTAAGAGNVISGNLGTGVEINGGSGNVVLGNLIGTDIYGRARLGNKRDGVDLIDGAADNTVGGSAAGAGNVISANGLQGVYLGDGGTSGNLIAGNDIGTDRAGTAALGNGAAGVVLNGAAGDVTGNTIGGAAPGAGNVISANARDGVLLSGRASGDVVLGNRIGTDITGTQALGNDTGVALDRGASGNTIGGTAPGSANVISGNATAGVDFRFRTSANAVLGNRIGTDVTGTQALGNGTGVEIESGTANTIGGTVPGAGNVISGNGNHALGSNPLGSGVEISGTGSSGNLVVGNLIGTDASGTSRLDNTVAGVRIVGGATGNTVGGAAAGAANVISGNSISGVEISGRGTGRNVVSGNFVGPDLTGHASLSDNTGVLIGDGAAGNTIGGTAPGSRNVVSGNVTGVDVKGGDTSGNVVLGNLVGTDVTGTGFLPNFLYGVLIDGAVANTVGGTTPASRNVISATRHWGLALFGASDNVVLGNFIGTDVTGTAALGNDVGLIIENGSSHNTVGGTVPGAGNVMSGNLFDGLDITDAGTTGNVVMGNLIGTDVSGTMSLGNLDNGVSIGASANTVGGTAAGAANVISGNHGQGVAIGGSGTSGNAVLGNLIGIDITGTRALGNGIDGVHLDPGAAHNTVGGPGAGNVISANGRYGVTVDGSSGNVVLGNVVGTDRGGSAALGNVVGIFLARGATGNTVGGQVAGAANLVSGNSYGVVVSDAGTGGNVLLGNLIGTDRSGTARLGNTRDGIILQNGTTHNVIGGPARGAGNVVSGSSVGVLISDGGTSSNLVQGNLIGTDIRGTADFGNTDEGVVVQFGASRNTIGGTTSGAANVISGSNLDVYIYGPGASGNLVQGNLIGTDKTGFVLLGNSNGGVVFDGGASANTVGGTAPGAANVISGSGVGVWFYGAGTGGNVAQGNLIGTDRNGTRSLGNNVGVVMAGGSTSNVVGGRVPRAANVISGNSWGVEMIGTGTSGNVVLGNLIGTDRRGTARLGNVNDGVIVEGGATRNTIGGTTPGDGNAIAFNGKGIVLVDGFASGEPIFADSILGNRIWGNAGPGIDINDDGPTANGLNPRALPNNGQNAPAITSLTRHGISGRLSSIPRTRFRIEFFATPVGGRADQGQVFLGFLNVTTNGGGTLSFTAPLAVPLGTVVTATATNLSTGDTSEFSPAGTQLLVTSEPSIFLRAGWQAVTLSAQVFFGGAPVTSGVVLFRVAGIPGTVTGRVNARGVATVTLFVPPLTWAGRYVITATYLGAGAIPAAVGDSVLTIALPYQVLGRRGL
jgi:hypothetical protein